MMAKKKREQDKTEALVKQLQEEEERKAREAAEEKARLMTAEGELEY